MVLGVCLSILTSHSSIVFLLLSEFYSMWSLWDELYQYKIW